MPQISLYVDKEMLEKVEKAASDEHISISKWVGKKIKNAIKGLVTIYLYFIIYSLLLSLVLVVIPTQVEIHFPKDQNRYPLSQV